VPELTAIHVFFMCYRIFGDVDFDRTGQISYHEFLAATFDRKNLTDENLRNAFEMISNHNDKFTSVHLAHITGRDVTAEQVDQMIEDANLPTNKEFDFDDVRINSILVYCATFAYWLT
jgi:Ca2+-binding EF-hand superfamily protein